MRTKIEQALGDIPALDVFLYEPTAVYQNVAKRVGAEKLTPARAMIADLVRRYAILGFDCTSLEIQKLAYFAERSVVRLGLDNQFDLRFEASRFGPYAPRLTHLLNALDGSYLHSHKRIADAGPMDTIWLDDGKRDRVAAYPGSTGKLYRPALETTDELVDGFETPLGMELLATIDWLVEHGERPTLAGLEQGLQNWSGGEDAARRKLRLFDDRMITIALERLCSWQTPPSAAQLQA